ncbi:unnamed protein product [Rangifer tarandus platyrhynchus]|uniref:Uncharacterized protein n=1 Tax=Rangifer tarandus platyrhynchus TaxID=3082113 RepID=A0ABN9A6V5_RANTA|nr:unnamed protein product [Rangifer tarandus platyrhynchus]
MVSSGFKQGNWNEVQRAIPHHPELRAQAATALATLGERGGPGPRQRRQARGSSSPRPSSFLVRPPRGRLGRAEPSESESHPAWLSRPRSPLPRPARSAAPPPRCAPGRPPAPRPPGASGPASRVRGGGRCRPALPIALPVQNSLV